ncbi:unnamed protein product, partial [Thlaspi arvense]
THFRGSYQPPPLHGVRNWRIEGSRLDFIVDQSRMSRVVELHEVMSISELKEAVLNEFSPEGSVASMNLFVFFGVDDDCTRKDGQDDNARENNTPASGHINTASSDEVLLSSRSDFLVVSGEGSFSGNAGVFSTPSQGMKRKWLGDGFSNNKPKGTSGPTKFRDAKPTTLSDLDDVEIIDNVQQAEEEFFKHARPVGYDSEFWDPLINDPLGGSDAADIMCPASEGFDAKAASMGMRREYMCFSNDVFDRSVDTYSGVIYPIENAADEDIPPEISKVVLFPPRSRRASGRRKEIRYPSAGEIPVPRVKKLIPNKSTKCFQPGHNRNTCSKPT